MLCILSKDIRIYINIISEKVYCNKAYEGGCKNAVSGKLHILEKQDSSIEECFDLCKKYSECERFFLGKSGTSNAGKCQLRRAGCTKDSNSSWKYYLIEDCSVGGTKYKLLEFKVEKIEDTLL